MAADSIVTAVVVDDDAGQRMMLVRLLQKEDIETQPFESAESALAALDHTRPPDLIITDLCMPGIDGWRFCRLLRSPEYAPFNKTPILIVSAAFSGPEADRIAADVGADAILPAPVDSRQLIRKVRNLQENGGSRRQLRVLVVDDSRSIASLLQSTFEKHGYRADIALSARQAVGAIEKTTYDAAVLDYHLPDRSGADLLEQVVEKCPDCVCIMITNDTRPELAADFLKRGASGYVRKPFSPEYLVELCARTRRRQVLLLAERLLEERSRRLRESEGWLRELFRTSRDAILVFNTDGIIVSTNPAACQMYGYAKGEMEGLTGRDIVHPDCWHLFDGFKRLPMHGGPFRAESVDVRKDGTAFNVEVSGSFFQYMGRFHLLAVTRDITDRKRAEAALRESEHRFRSFVENANDIVYALSPGGVFTYVSPNWRTFMGEPAEAAFGRSFELYVHPEDVHLCRDFLQKVLRTGETHTSVEYRALHRNGDVAWHMSRGAPLRDEADNVVGYIGIARDVTERRRMEDALRESEARYRSLTENFPDGALFLFDEEFRYLAADGKAFARAGLTSDAVVGKTVAEVFPEHWDFLQPYLRATLRGEDTRYEVTYKGRIYSNQCLPVVNDDGRIRQGIVVTQDITDALGTQAEKAKLEVQFHQAQRMESIGRLAGGVAHDLNNLIAPILGYGEMILDELGLEDGRRASVEAMVQAGLGARDLVRQLLAFSRKQALDVRPVDINQVLTRFEKLLRRTIREDVAIEMRLAPSLPSVMGDVGQLEQVIMNLSVNAQDAMENGGVLTFETSVETITEEDVAAHEGVAPGSFVTLTVSDTGCGMDACIREHVFEPFFTTKEKDKGTGLGMATVYGIVHQHSGFIHVWSTPERGATFRIFLPIFRRNPEAQEIGSTDADADLRGAGTILLVEDNHGVREMTRSVLERQGYTVLAAETGKEAMEILERRGGGVHLLLIDVVLPDMDGGELFNVISNRFPRPKVLYMSGYTDNVVAQKGVLKEGVTLIQKPFSIKTLANMVRQAMEKE